jgi:hypothetical protein
MTPIDVAEQLSFGTNWQSANVLPTADRPASDSFSQSTPGRHHHRLFHRINPRKR